jgi:hypothetical protein
MSSRTAWRSLRTALRKTPTTSGHDKVKAGIQDLLVDGLGADRRHVTFEQRVPEAQGRIDAILGRTAFEVKSDLVRELGDAEGQLSRYLPEREKATGNRFVGIATDGLDWRYDARTGQPRSPTAVPQLDRGIGTHSSPLVALVTVYCSVSVIKFLSGNQRQPTWRCYRSTIRTSADRSPSSSRASSAAQ